jgi:hypothetical protein
MNKISQENFDRFIKALNSPMIEVVEETGILDKRKQGIFTFTVNLKSDKFIKPEQCPSLSDEFYCEADRLGNILLGQIPSWNNTGHIGWFSNEWRAK